MIEKAFLLRLPPWPFAAIDLASKQQDEKKGACAIHTAGLQENIKVPLFMMQVYSYCRRFRYSSRQNPRGLIQDDPTAHAYDTKASMINLGRVRSWQEKTRAFPTLVCMI